MLTKAKDGEQKQKPPYGVAFIFAEAKNPHGREGGASLNSVKMDIFGLEERGGSLHFFVENGMLMALC